MYAPIWNASASGMAFSSNFIIPWGGVLMTRTISAASRMFRDSSDPFFKVFFGLMIFPPSG